MEVKIKEFEEQAINAVCVLRNLLGATRIDVSVHIDPYEKGCKTDVSFFTSIPADASRIPECGPACKGD